MDFFDPPLQLDISSTNQHKIIRADRFLFRKPENVLILFFNSSLWTGNSDYFEKHQFHRKKLIFATKCTKQIKVWHYVYKGLAIVCGQFYD
jgi:hypothetical protein